MLLLYLHYYFLCANTFIFKTDFFRDLDFRIPQMKSNESIVWIHLIASQDRESSDEIISIITLSRL